MRSDTNQRFISVGLLLFNIMVISRWSIPYRGGVVILLGGMLRKPGQAPAVWAFGLCAPLPFT